MQGGQLVLEAPTGTGKTVVMLSGALESALEQGKRILYVTRTNSQQEQAIREVAAIQDRLKRPLRALALQGRHRLCLKLEDAADPDLLDSSPEDLSHYCSNAKKLAGDLTMRFARPGETVLALDGKTYTLDESMTVIADKNQVHGIGGIMGGEDTGVRDDTTDVFLEVAYFDPIRTAASGRPVATIHRASPTWCMVATHGPARAAGAARSRCCRAGTCSARSRCTQAAARCACAVPALDAPACFSTSPA